MDLDINNYNLDDILNLFKIPSNFTESHLKMAKQIVLKTHPDKSGLSSEYFLFYSKAYKTLYSIYTFKNKMTKDTASNTEYEVDTTDNAKAKILDHFFEKTQTTKDPKQFNKWFNQQFEQLQEATDNGYGDWLKSDTDIYKQETGSTAEQMLKYKQQSKSKSVIQYDGIGDTQSTFTGTLLGDSTGANFSSNMFSGLAYQDIKQAHTETVIPITDKDYDAVKKFNNVEEYTRYRNDQNTTPLSETESHSIMQKQKDCDEVMTTNRAFYYAKQHEENAKKTTLFWGRLQSLT
jgi:hypothetical protein